MAITAYQGPLIATGGFGSPYFTGGTSDYNPTPGPSLFSHGSGILDTRWGPFNSGDVTNVIPGWFGCDNVCVIDQAPATASATNIAAAQVPVAGTALTLAAASTGITVLTSALAYTPGNVFPANALMIDGNPAFVQLGTMAGGISMYDPRTTSARTLLFTSVGNDSAATVAIVGVDVYGVLVHETVTLSNATTASSKKALKAVVSITPAGTLSGANLSVGTTDVFGFALAAYEFQFVQIYWNATLISANTGYTAPVTTSPATATTGDVRGTYAVQSASDGTKKLQVFVTPQVWNNTATTLFGVKQF